MDYKEIRFMQGLNAVQQLYAEKYGIWVPGTVNPEPGLKYLCFTAEEANSTVGYTSALSTPPVIYKSTDGQTWESWDGTSVTLANIGDRIYVYGENSTLSTAILTYTNFVMTGLIAASGDVTTLLTKEGTDTLTQRYVFNHLFSGCTSLTSAPELPATTLSRNCYDSMFSGCTSLTDAPLLPAKDVTVESCYSTMFFRCGNLKHIKVLAENWGAGVYVSHDWVYNVWSSLSDRGIFEKPETLEMPVGRDGIPNSWTVVNF